MSRPPSAERWFHTLVVMGASLTACGGKTEEQAPSSPALGGMNGGGGSQQAAGSAHASGASAGGASSGASAGGASSGPIKPQDCALEGQFACDDYQTRTNCRCKPYAPPVPSACDNPLDFTCVRLPCESRPDRICSEPDHVDCRCDTSGLRPEDCPTPEQFFCNSVYPYFYDCSCRSDPAPDPDSCARAHYFCCQSANPRFGCDCSCLQIK